MVVIMLNIRSNVCPEDGEVWCAQNVGTHLHGVTYPVTIIIVTVVRTCNLIQ
jgi:hypothetical protein